MPSSSDFPDLIDVLINIGAVIPALIMMLQAFTALIGLYLVSSSFIEIWGVTNDNALKYVAGRQKYSIGSAIITLFIGSFLLALSTLELVGVLSRTLSGGYASSRITAESLAYTSGGGLEEKAQIATLVLLGIMQVVGFIAILKGWLTLNQYYNQQGQASLRQSWGWMIGGILAWNFKWFSDVINNTLGFNLIGLFTPF